jgi:hypothetical protein
MIVVDFEGNEVNSVRKIHKAEIKLINNSVFYKYYYKYLWTVIKEVRESELLSVRDENDNEFYINTKQILYIREADAE